MKRKKEFCNYIIPDDLIIEDIKISQLEMNNLEDGYW